MDRNKLTSYFLILLLILSFFSCSTTKNSSAQKEPQKYLAYTWNESKFQYLEVWEMDTIREFVTNNVEENEVVFIRVFGKGNPEYSMEVSQRSAEMIRDYIDKVVGLPQNQIVILGGSDNYDEHIVKMAIA